MAGMTPKSIFFFGQLEHLESKTTCLDNFLEVLLWKYNLRYPRYSPYGCRWFSFAKQPTWGSNQEKQIDFTTKWSEKIGLPLIVKGNRNSAENTDTKSHIFFLVHVRRKPPILVYQCWTDFQVCNTNGLSSISTNDSLGQLCSQEQLLSEFQTSRQGLEWPIWFDDGWSKSSKPGDFFWFLKEFDNLITKQKGFDIFLIIFQEYS